MKKYLIADEWKVIEEGFHSEYNRITESVFSIGNGQIGQRATFEEHYSGDSLQGSYVAGVYYPDKTKVGWWKNGYPEYFAKVLNSVNWIGLDIKINGHRVDLNQMEVTEFQRTLDMKRGLLSRSFTASFPSGERIKVQAHRFCSMHRNELGVLWYELTPLNFDATIELTSYLDGDVKNEDSNYDEKFWNPVGHDEVEGRLSLVADTKKTNFRVAASLITQVQGLENEVYSAVSRPNYVASCYKGQIKASKSLVIQKKAIVLSSLNYEKVSILEESCQKLKEVSDLSFNLLLEEHEDAWQKRWDISDIRIEGDIEAQQGIRFNIFHLNQTYTGQDERLNIGPKGFTGEKYGGSTYWDTEAYCIPFYLSTAESSVARQLLTYRYKQLDKAIENAEKLGFKQGAALFPMVTMNGEECHNEWEITFEEIHRNGAIAFAIYDYIRYTGDEGYLRDGGLEVLTAIARFWAQRVNWSEPKKAYVMLGVTGPNEYENNVNNNWYTNYIAAWCIRYASECIEEMKKSHMDYFIDFARKVQWKDEEQTQWLDIERNMFYPKDDTRGIFLQQEGYLDKVIRPTSSLQSSDMPLCQNWSWDRILRSCFIKQADVLQGLYFFEEHFTVEEIKRNFDFYEPLTVHESSLSPCVHSILASKIDQPELAYQMYLRTSRLDLDDYNNDTEDGLHITSMAGTWMSIVKGFGGQRIKENTLALDPVIPKDWDALSFKIYYRQILLEVHVDKDQTRIVNHSNRDLEILLRDQRVNLAAKQSVKM